MQIIRLFGIKLKVNNWFFVLTVLFVLSGYLYKILLVYGAVLWHELAHAITARAAGLKVREVELLPFGGVARISSLNETGIRKEFLISAAGPLASLVLAAVSYIGMTYSKDWLEGWQFLYKVNIVLVLFNLLPALPLDGGRIMRACLNTVFDYKKATMITVKLSRGISLFLLIWVLYTYCFRNEINLTFIIGAIFIYMAANVEIVFAGFRTMRMLANKKEQLNSRGFLPTNHFTVADKMLVQDVIRLFVPEAYHIVLVIDPERMTYCGTLTETQIWDRLTEKGVSVSISQFL
ncbi:hypothetical protein P22_3583 [Propionispora sp. 2/2-37]|uniref:M50 family metallopeptidase n=1 Tax=Propionispora sp. 2/2-37 TaxID=1677858 RepID=UPI0006BB988B|nr:M50 family metallopeptidase [Propionispora sp. 2/2-37]CUH97453.1 hypothetical protein P22_3583 [Propionispora sp. 2/2-37]